MSLNLKGMSTETRNPNTMDLDIMSPLEVVTVMNQEDAKVPAAITERASSCDDGGATWFFSSYGGILELRPGIQAASCVGPGKSNLPFELRRKAGDCSRVTAGPIDLI